MILPTSDAGGEIKVVVNNTGDLTGAMAKGFGTGLTLGLVGSTVTANYETAVTLTDQGRTITRNGMQQAIRTVIGNTRLSPGIQATTMAVASARVAESVLRRVLTDMQRNGELPKSTVMQPRAS